MKMENIFLNVTVKMNGYFGNWKTAIDETYELSKKLNTPCLMNYSNQYQFKIYPSMSQSEIDILKEAEIIIGL